VISLHVALPLFDRGAPEKALARARLNEAEAQALAFRAVLRAQVVASRALVVERREAARRYRDTALPGTERLERIAQVSYEAGERGILELLDAFRTASAARVRQADLDAAAREAEIELEFVSGWEMP
jgi:cobalt-zinc-cadmium efflux system outer membrane protein